MKFLVFKFLSFIFKTLEFSNRKFNEINNKKKYNLPNSVALGKVDMVGENIKIGENTYMNSGTILSGNNSKIEIGKWCAIGYNVNIISFSHDTIISTGPENERPVKEADIIIGNNVWIGSNVFIKEGVFIDDNSIIGANSVVVKNVKKNEIVGGVPANHIRFKFIN